MLKNQGAENVKHGSQLSVSSKDLTECTGFEQGSRSDDEYNCFVHELEMDRGNESSDDDIESVDISASFCNINFERVTLTFNDISFRRSNSMDSEESEIFDDVQKLKDTSYFYRRQSSVLKRRLMAAIAVLTIVFVVALWQVMSSVTNKQSRPLGIQSHPDRIGGGDGIDLSSSNLQYVSANIEATDYVTDISSSNAKYDSANMDYQSQFFLQQEKPIISPLELGLNDQAAGQGSSDTGEPSSLVENLPLMEYKSTNIRRGRNAASKPEFLP